MPVQTTNDALSQAFQLLCEVVRDSYSSGRICLGAPLKLELQRRTRRNFNEQLLGYPRFGDFLRAAEVAGQVQLLKTPGGDLEVRLPENELRPGAPSRLFFAAPVAPAPPPTSPAARLAAPATLGTHPMQSFSVSNSQPVRVRQDLWDAFNSSFGSWAYNRRTDAAHKVPPNLFGPTASNPDLVEIPAGRERTLEWMRSFAGMQDTDTKAMLLAMLSSDSAPYNFRRMISADWKLRRAWSRYHIQQVLAAIDAWATSNGLHPQRVATPLAERVQYRSWGQTQVRGYPPVVLQNPVVEPPPPPVPAPARPLSIHEGLNSRLETLVDQLIDELLRLRGALRFISPKQ
jgi:hypothetical protein